MIRERDVAQNHLVVVAIKRAPHPPSRFCMLSSHCTPRSAASIRCPGTSRAVTPMHERRVIHVRIKIAPGFKRPTARFCVLFWICQYRRPEFGYQQPIQISLQRRMVRRQSRLFQRHHRDARIPHRRNTAAGESCRPLQFQRKFLNLAERQRITTCVPSPSKRKIAPSSTINAAYPSVRSISSSIHCFASRSALFRSVHHGSQALSSSRVHCKQPDSSRDQLFTPVERRLLRRVQIHARMFRQAKIRPQRGKNCHRNHDAARPSKDIS